MASSETRHKTNEVIVDVVAFMADRFGLTSEQIEDEFNLDLISIQNSIYNLETSISESQ